MTCISRCTRRRAPSRAGRRATRAETRSASIAGPAARRRSCTRSGTACSAAARIRGPRSTLPASCRGGAQLASITDDKAWAAESFKIARLRLQVADRRGRRAVHAVQRVPGEGAAHRQSARSARRCAARAAAEHRPAVIAPRGADTVKPSCASPRRSARWNRRCCGRRGRAAYGCRAGGFRRLAVGRRCRRRRNGNS